MSDTVLLALIAMFGSITTTIISSVIVWLKAKDAFNVSKNNSARVAEVHEIVNSQRTAMEVKIDTMTKRIEELNKVILSQTRNATDLATSRSETDQLRTDQSKKKGQ